MSEHLATQPETPAPAFEPEEIDAEEVAECARRLMVWLLQYRGSVVVLRHICRFGPYRVRRVDVARRSMNLLAARGLVTPVPNIRIKHRLNKEAWVIQV